MRPVSYCVAADADDVIPKNSLAGEWGWLLAGDTLGHLDLFVALPAVPKLSTVN